MDPTETQIPLDRDAAYDAIWPELADEIHQLGFDFIGSGDHMSDAEGDALQWLLDEITGNVCMPDEAVLMAIALMNASAHADYDPECDAYAEDGRNDGDGPDDTEPTDPIPPWHDPEFEMHLAMEAAYDAVSALSPDRQHALIASVIMASADPLAMSTKLHASIQPLLDARRRDETYYRGWTVDQMLEVIVGRSVAGEPLSEYEQYFLSDLDPDDGPGESADDRR